jgi:omega-6 fatty acid desaturase (delta-12 desaturase)
MRALAPYACPSNGMGIMLFVLEYLMYWGAIAVVLFAPWLTVKIMASAFAGFKLSAFVTLAHDAAHRTLVVGKSLNKCLALFLFVPCMHNYRLWVWDHHEIHHQETNGDHFDSYTPYSKAEFDRLSWPMQLFERVIRAPNFVGFGLHYFFQRMLKVRIFPRTGLPRRHLASARRHCMVLLAYHVALIAALLGAATVAPISAGMAVFLGFFLPLCVFSAVTGGSLYLMHTNHRVPWFKGELDRAGDGAPELCATHLSLPRPISRFIHNVFAHSVHHVHAGIPSYRLLEAQQRLDLLLGDAAVVQPLTLGGILATLNRCKLYDFEKHQWLDFDGKPSTAPLILASHRLQQDHFLATSGKLAAQYRSNALGTGRSTGT